MIVFPLSSFNRYFGNNPLQTLTKIRDESIENGNPELAKKQREELGNDFIVAFGVGFPDTNDGNSICHYKVNKRYYDLNMLDSNSEEEEDEE